MAYLPNYGSQQHSNYENALNAEIEPIAYRVLSKRILGDSGVFLHAIGGIEDHVHIAVSIPPTLLISDWIGQLKGGTSHDVNQEFGKKQKVLQWQTGYGVVSFGTRDLEWVKAYVHNQREHHQRNGTHRRLEVVDILEA